MTIDGNEACAGIAYQLSDVIIDSAPPKTDVTQLLSSEARFQITAQHDPEHNKALSAQIHDDINRRLALYNELAKH